MKTIERERMVKEIVGYEANDGTRFNTESECKEYESSLKGIVNKRIFDNTLLRTCEYNLYELGSDEYEYIILNTLETAEQVYDLEMYNKINHCAHNKTFETGKKYVLAGYEWDGFDCIIELKNLLDNFTIGLVNLSKYGCRKEVKDYLAGLLDRINNEEIEALKNSENKK